MYQCLILLCLRLSLSKNYKQLGDMFCYYDEHVYCSLSLCISSQCCSDHRNCVEKPWWHFFLVSGIFDYILKVDSGEVRRNEGKERGASHAIKLGTLQS